MKIALLDGPACCTEGALQNDRTTTFLETVQKHSLNDCVANCLKPYCGYNVYPRTL